MPDLLYHGKSILLQRLGEKVVRDYFFLYIAGTEELRVDSQLHLRRAEPDPGRGKRVFYLVDEGTLRAVKLYSQGHSFEEINSLLEGEVSGLQGVLEEFATLINSGLLFAPAAPMPACQSSGVVKALCLHMAFDCNLQCRYCFAGRSAPYA